MMHNKCYWDYKSWANKSVKSLCRTTSFIWTKIFLELLELLVLQIFVVSVKLPHISSVR